MGFGCDSIVNAEALLGGLDISIIICERGGDTLRSIPLLSKLAQHVELSRNHDGDARAEKC
jgi:hypothetical protein